MAEVRTLAIVPLNGANYPTWKVQCCMAFMKDGLWNIVNGTETDPGDEEATASQHIKFIARRDRALTIIILSVEPSLLYLIGDPDNPVTVWKKLGDQFQKKTWADKLELCRKLYSLRLKDGEPVQDHIKSMTKVFVSLSVVSDPVTEEDRVVHLLASLPNSFSMLVTALEANPDVPAIEVVTEKLLHEERKMREGQCDDSEYFRALTAHSSNLKVLKCYYCGKPGISNVTVAFELQMKESINLRNSNYRRFTNFHC